jgi:hypothetical protein
MSQQGRWLARWLVAGFCAGAVLAARVPPSRIQTRALPTSTIAEVPLADLQDRIDRLLQSGFDRPDAALASLSAMARSQPAHAQRMLLTARGLVAANAGRAALAESAAGSLAASSDVLSLADSLLVKATLAQTQGQPGLSEQAARAALEHYRSQCPDTTDLRLAHAVFEALQILARQGGSSGRSHVAREHALAAAELARGAGDAARQAWALAHAADQSLSLGDTHAVQQDLARATTTGAAGRIAAHAGTSAHLRDPGVPKPRRRRRCASCSRSRAGVRAARPIAAA